MHTSSKSIQALSPLTYYPVSLHIDVIAHTNLVDLGLVCARLGSLVRQRSCQLVDAAELVVESRGVEEWAEIEAVVVGGV